jgi:(S)-2-hydroxyglutarate dehydrogenase
METSCDFLIVGAGIVGLTVAFELKKRHKSSKIIILEKELQVGIHASGRNSGVLHSGIYYGSDTLKARVCSAGGESMMEFAKEEKIDYAQDGKVILATSEDQLSTIDKLLDNAKNNNIKAERIDQQQLREIEPFAANGPAAIYCPTTAVIDSKKVVERLKEKLENDGVSFIFDAKANKLIDDNSIETTKGVVGFGFLYNCAGAYADTVSNLFGLANEYALVPFKGIYWKLSDAANHKIKSSIYPVPDISLPFLGVHLTRVIGGDVYVGPTAIPVLGRENYSGYCGIKTHEAFETISQLSKMYFQNKKSFRRMAYMELSKYRKINFLNEAQKLMPSLRAEDMVPTKKAGIRPQLVNKVTGELEMDYILKSGRNSMHVLNAISPAFTSSFEFAKMIISKSAV